MKAEDVKLAIVVAKAKNGTIGMNNQLPWKISEDLKYFKKITMGHPMLMGRKTFDSIGKPLPGRVTFVVTRQKDWFVDGVTACSTIADAIEMAKKEAAQSLKEYVMIVGGAELYRQVLPEVDRVYLTLVDAEIEGDAFFPEFDFGAWREVERADFPASEAADHPFAFIVLDKAVE